MGQKYLIKKAKTSKFFLWLLNWSLGRMIPFNRPHGFKVIKIEDWSLTTLIPFRKRNFNHIRGLHACALATITEFTSGFLLMLHLDPKKYRLILQRLEVNYHFQGKTDAYGKFTISEEWFNANVLEPIHSSVAVIVPCDVSIHDTNGNQLTTGKVFWQIKNWEKVKTKV